MQEELVNNDKTNQRIKRYEWDCLAIGIYYGEVEIVKILEEKGIEKGKSSSHIEAAILSYRNKDVKEIITKMNERNYHILKRGLRASAKNNNIKGAELLINKGANINEIDILYQNLIIFF